MTAAMAVETTTTEVATVVEVTTTARAAEVAAVATMATKTGIASHSPRALTASRLSITVKLPKVSRHTSRLRATMAKAIGRATTAQGTSNPRTMFIVDRTLRNRSNFAEEDF